MSRHEAYKKGEFDEVYWKHARRMMKNATFVRREIVKIGDKTFRLEIVSLNCNYYLATMQVHEKTLGRVKGTPYKFVAFCSESGASNRLEELKAALESGEIENF